MRFKGFPRVQKDLGTETRTKTSFFYEKSNAYDPYAMALARSTQATVTGIDVVGHLPTEISRFCEFFMITVESCQLWYENETTDDDQFHRVV